MIDPKNITDYNRSDDELEEFLIFCVMVANKNSDRTAVAVEHLMNQRRGGEPPFRCLRRLVNDGTLMMRLVESRCGEYRRRWRTLSELAFGWGGRLRDVSPRVLETVYGIGPKTARFFVMHTQDGAQYAALDTHVLKHLKAVGVADIPSKTPSNPKQYARIETLFLSDAWLNGKTPAEHDLEIWTHYSGRGVMV